MVADKGIVVHCMYLYLDIVQNIYAQYTYRAITNIIASFEIVILQEQK